MQLAGEPIENETDHVRPTDESLRGIIYRAAYLLNYTRSPFTERITEGMAQQMAEATGRKLPALDRDGSAAFAQGRRGAGGCRPLVVSDSPSATA
ncbi:hypothetical protein BH18ACT12_BH18ACT12_11950 [soil metagenome]